MAHRPNKRRSGRPAKRPEEERLTGRHFLRQRDKKWNRRRVFVEKQPTSARPVLMNLLTTQMSYEKMDFKVVKFSADSHLILQSTHVLQPEVEVTVLALGADKALLTMNITFKQGSLLYQASLTRKLQCHYEEKTDVGYSANKLAVYRLATKLV
ncbi:hypothetical protein J6590_059370 [Homalodisca vitripennis]|nr:hypothetical protein J6590_059370 [Homalodisca vitripennis]